MAMNDTQNRKKTFKYPDHINEVQRIQQINVSTQFPVYVSLLHATNQTLFDIRIWSNNQPTHKGLFLTHAGGLRLIDLLDSFLAGEDLTDQLDGTAEIKRFGNGLNGKAER